MPFYVAKTQCSECMFSPNAIVSARRRRMILKECREQDGHFVCHVPQVRKNAGEKVVSTDVCCYGFYQANPMATNLMRIAHRLGAVQFINVEKKKT